MKKELILSIIIISLGLAFSISNVALALSEKDINYPVAELRGCKNEKECRAYCDRPENMRPCVAFAEKYNLIEKEEIKKAKIIAEIKDGPGGCKSPQECETYCDEISHIDECVAFAENNNILPPEELKEAQKIRDAIKGGAKMPGGCETKEQCDAYCESPNHMEECIDFAIKAGIMPPKEQEEAQKMLQAVKKGAKPPPCKNKKACDAYCGEESHFEECISFAEAAGFMSKEEAEMIKKTGGKGPGGCKGKEECNAFCESGEENMMVCAEFAVQNGMMPQKDYEMMKKTKGKGPGGCKSKNECEAFCNNPDNQETCFQFGLEHGMIPKEELQKMEEGKKQFRESLNQAPPEVIDCISQKVGPDMMEKLKSGTAIPPREAGEGMRECFEKMMEKMGPPCEGEDCPPPCEGENCRPPQEGQGMFNRARGFIREMMPGNNQGGGQSASTRVSINKESSGLYLIKINEPNGIKEFSFTSEGSNPYSGGLSGCPKDYSNSTTIIFPVKAVITDCKDEVHEFTIQGEGSAKSGGNDQKMQQEIQMNMQQNMAGPGGCKTPQECDEFCKNNQKECMNFMPAGKQQPCEGNNCPQPDGTGQQQKSGIFDRAKNFIRQFAPGTGGGMPSDQPCEGDNCPPPCEGEDCQMQPGEFKCEGENCPAGNMMPGTYMPPREGAQFEGTGGYRIPSPDEINQMQNRMMEGMQYMEQRPMENMGPQQMPGGQMPPSGEKQYMNQEMPRYEQQPMYQQQPMQTMPNSDGGYIPPANMQPMDNYQPPAQINPPADFQNPPENSPPPSSSIQPPLGLQQSQLQTIIRLQLSKKSRPSNFKLAADKALANAISELIYSPNCGTASALCALKQSAQNQLSDLISDKIYPPSKFSKSDSPLHNLKGEMQNKISELIAEKIYNNR